MEIEQNINCKKCGRSPWAIVCMCERPFEDEWILALLNIMVEELRIGAKRQGQIVDSTCIAITSYMRGRESK